VAGSNMVWTVSRTARRAARFLLAANCQLGAADRTRGAELLAMRELSGFSARRPDGRCCFRTLRTAALAGHAHVDMCIDMLTASARQLLMQSTCRLALLRGTRDFGCAELPKHL
jgi:hypothetical protein